MAGSVLSSTPGTRHHGPSDPPRPRWQRRLNLAVLVLACCAAAWPALGRFTKHPGETLVLLMPPALGAFLWFGWPRARRTPWWKYALYLVMLTPILAAAEYFLAFVARGRVLWVEVFWALYFVVGLRLAWTTWSWTAGRMGERWRRWGRRQRGQERRRDARTRGRGETADTETSRGTDKEQRQKTECRRTGDSRKGSQQAAGHRLPGEPWVRIRLTMLIVPTRAMLTLFVFVPLVLGLLVHRIKIGNRTDAEGRSNLPVEEVAFRTADGMVLSGWFLPDRDSDRTVVICHGSGANKSNFVEYMRVFRYQGYNSLIFDFRGHGASEGHTCTFGLFEDADVIAAVDWLKTQRPERSRHVYGLGSSMGAMALARAAARDPRIEAVVLDSCFASAPLLAEQHLGRLPIVGEPLSVLIPAALSLHAGRSLWNVDARPAVAAIAPRPILLIHGTEDIFIPRVNMEILFAAAKPPRQRWLGPGPHSNIMSTDFAAYQTKVIRFLDNAAAGMEQQ